MFKKLNRFEEVFLITTLALMVALIFGQVVGRYVFQSAPSWTEEATRYIHIFQVWMGASYAEKLREHIRITAFVDLFKGNIRKIIDMISTYILFILVLIVVLFVTQLVSITFNHELATSGT